jgi:integrase
MAILDREGITTILTELPGHEVYARAIVALFTEMQLGEVLALRWRNVDLDGKVIKVREAVEETKEHGLQVKAPKTRAGRRDIDLLDIVVDGLRDHRRAQLEFRIALGAGKLPVDARVFPTIEGGPRRPAMPLGHGGS